MKWMWKEVVVSQFKLLSRHFSTGTSKYDVGMLTTAPRRTVLNILADSTCILQHSVTCEYYVSYYDKNE
jgi:hypothetical protein